MTAARGVWYNKEKQRGGERNPSAGFPSRSGCHLVSRGGFLRFGTIKREKAERIAAIYKAHGVSVAEVVTAAAGYLTEHGDEGAERIKAAAARYNATKAEAPGTPGEPADDREDAPGDPGRE